jgi:hypothetical protein
VKLVAILAAGAIACGASAAANPWQPSMAAAVSYASHRHGVIAFAVPRADRDRRARPAPRARAPRRDALLHTRDRPLGLSRIDAADQARYFLWIDSLVASRHRAYAMKLLNTITPAQRWGVARVRPPGWRLYFKAGWGSGTGWVDHQVALLTGGDERVSVAILTQSDGSHAYGKQTLRGIAMRLLRSLG